MTRFEKVLAAANWSTARTSRNSKGIVGRVGADGGKVGRSLSKGLGDLYQRVIADPTNSGVSFSANSADSDTKLGPAHHGR